MRDRPGSPEAGTTTEAAINLASVIALGALGDFRDAIAAMNPDTNISSPTRAVRDSNGPAREWRAENGSRVRSYDQGGRAEWDSQNRLTRMTDRASNTFQMTYEGNSMQPSRIQGSNGVDARAGDTQLTVDHQNGAVSIHDRLEDTASSFALDGTSRQVVDGPKGRFTTETFYNPVDQSLTTRITEAGVDHIDQRVTRRDGSGHHLMIFPTGQGGNGGLEMVPLSQQFAPGRENRSFTTVENGLLVSRVIPSIREIKFSQGSGPGLADLEITTHDGFSYYVADVDGDGRAGLVRRGLRPGPAAQ